MRIAVVLLALPLVVCAQTDQTATADNAHFPVKRVVLYKNGVGYFEHTGRVRGNQDFSVDFTTAQLNDVLKSLTVLDLGEGKISSIRYNSIAPVSQRLSGLRLALGENASRADFLNALRGTRLEVHSRSDSATGKLLSVERDHRTNNTGDTVDVTELALVTDSGEMRTFELIPATSVRIADRELSQDVNRYLNTIGSSRGADVRRMYISTVGNGERELQVSYISEVPVWKSTYRVILPDGTGRKPILQGWAIVDNTVGEDWNNVQLSLVAGAPQSFVQDISQPYYVNRPVVALPDSVNPAPQSHQATMSPPPPPPIVMASGTVLKGTVTDPSGAAVQGATVTLRNETTGASQTTTTDSSGFYSFQNIQGGNSAVFVDKQGFRRIQMSNIYLGVGRVNEIHPTLQVASASEVVEVTASAVSVNTESAEISSISPEADATAYGDLFSYDLKQRISIGKDQSALVPILQSPIEAEKVTVWNESTPRALRALWVKNTSDQTLDGGTFNVIDHGTFAGEGILDPIHADERRLISYALDTAVQVKLEHAAKKSDGDSDEDDDDITNDDGTPRTLHLVRIAKGTMVVSTEQRRRQAYTVHNADTTPRQVVIERAADARWHLAGNLKPEEITASLERFRVSVDPGQTARLDLEEYHPSQQEFVLTNLTSDEVVLFTDQKLLTPEMQQTFQRALGIKAAIGEIDVQLNARNLESQAIANDQNRLRENMKSLKGSVEERTLLQRYTHELNAQEDRLASIRRESVELREKRNRANADLTRLLLAINYEPQHTATSGGQ